MILPEGEPDSRQQEHVVHVVLLLLLLVPATAIMIHDQLIQLPNADLCVLMHVPDILLLYHRCSCRVSLSSSASPYSSSSSSRRM